jgi:hypothetical protein
MKGKLLLGAALVSLPMIAGGLAIANTPMPADEQPRQANEQGYLCPVTGEELPCPKCCPLNSK